MDEEQLQQNPVTEEKKWFTPLAQVTPVSKGLAAALFVLLPFIGFWLGMEYGKTCAQETAVPVVPVPAEQIVEEDVDVISGEDGDTEEMVSNDAVEVVNDDEQPEEGAATFSYKYTFSVQGTAETLTINKDGTWEYTNDLPGTETETPGNRSGTLDADTLQEVHALTDSYNVLEFTIEQEDDPALLCEGYLIWEYEADGEEVTLRSPCAPEDTEDTRAVLDAMSELQKEIAILVLQ